MKKTITILLICTMLFSLVACTKNNGSTQVPNVTNPTNTTQGTAPTTQPTEAPTEPGTDDNDENTKDQSSSEWDKLTPTSKLSELEAWLPSLNEMHVVEKEDCAIYYNAAKTFLFIDSREERTPASVVFELKKTGSFSMNGKRQDFYTFVVQLDYTTDSSCDKLNVDPGSILLFEVDADGSDMQYGSNLDFDSLFDSANKRALN